jgi:hypothetical protein
LNNFDDIRRLVITDPYLMDLLTPMTTEPELFDAVIALGRRIAIEITTAELEAIVNANRRIWFERWIAP